MPRPPTPRNPGPANPPRLPTGRGLDNGPSLFGNSTTGRILNSDIAGAGRGLGLPGYGYDIDQYGVVTSGDILNNLNYFAGGSPSNPLPFYGEIGDWPDNLPPRIRPHDGVTVSNDAFSPTPSTLLSVADLLGADPDYFARGNVRRGTTPTDVGNFAVSGSLDFNRYNPNSRHPGPGTPADGPATGNVTLIGPNSTPAPSPNNEIPPARDYFPNSGQDSYTWNTYYSDSPGADRYTWDQYSDSPASGRLPWPDGPSIRLSPLDPEVAVTPTGGEPDFKFPSDPDPDLLPSRRPPRAGDYFDFTGSGAVAGRNVVPPMNFGNRPMPNLAGFGLGPNIPPWQLGLQAAGGNVPGGDIYLSGQLANHTPGNDGTTLIDTNEGISDQQLVDNQRSSLGLPPQAPRGPGGNVTSSGTEGAPTGMTVVGHDQANGQPIYRDGAGNLFVNPGTGTIMDQAGRFSNNGTTGNFTADKTTEGFVAAGGYAGSPNRAVAPDSGKDSFGNGAAGVIDPDTGMPRRTQSSSSNPSFQIGQKAGAPTLRTGDPASAAAYNAWLMQQPEYKTWMHNLLVKSPTGSSSFSVPGLTPYAGSGGG